MLKIRSRISVTDMQNSHFFFYFPYSLPDVSAGMIARELWWTSQEVSQADIIITLALQAHISAGGRTASPLVAKF
jgi:hypothetical protein